MVSSVKRHAIKKGYRLLRVAADKTQQDVEDQAGLEVGRFFKIENGRILPRDEEAKAIARVLRVPVSSLPGYQPPSPAPSSEQEARVPA